MKYYISSISSIFTSFIIFNMHSATYKNSSDTHQKRNCDWKEPSTVENHRNYSRHELVNSKRCNLISQKCQFKKAQDYLLELEKWHISCILWFKTILYLLSMQEWNQIRNSISKEIKICENIKKLQKYVNI